MPKIEFDFEFAIGDFITHKSYNPRVTATASRNGEVEHPAQFIVLGYFIDACPAGAQGAYIVRSVNGTGNVNGETFKLAAVEVKAYPDVATLISELLEHRAQYKLLLDQRFEELKAKRKAILKAEGVESDE